MNFGSYNPVYLEINNFLLLMNFRRWKDDTNINHLAKFQYLLYADKYLLQILHFQAYGLSVLIH